MYEPPPQNREFNWIWIKWVFGLWAYIKDSLVDITSDQTIAGDKTFTGDMLVSATSLDVGNNTESAPNVTINASATGDPFLQFEQDGSPKAFHQYLDSDDSFNTNSDGVINLKPFNVNTVQLDNDSTAGNTRFLIYDVDNGQLERVSVGAADSGGAGFKVLRIPN